MSLFSDIGSAFSSISNVVSSIAKDLGPIANIGEELLTGGVGGLAQDIFGQLAQSLFTNSSNGTVFSNNVNLFGTSLPNPLSALNGLLGGANSAISSFGSSSIGDVLKQLLSAVGGQPAQAPGLSSPVSVPTLTNRLASIGSVASAGGPVYSAASNPSTVVGSGNDWINPALQQAQQGGAFSTQPTATEQSLLNSITDPSQRAQMQLQMQMQKQAEIASMVSNILNILHSTSMGIIGNMKQ